MLHKTNEAFKQKISEFAALGASPKMQPFEHSASDVIAKPYKKEEHQ